jgi:hypothetical protein
MVGRYWLRLEWRALVRALATSGATQRAAIRDALAFRSERHSLAPRAAERERVLEINEGLAQYTATVIAAAATEQARRDAIDGLLQGSEAESLVRTFAYASGPAHGLLPDAHAPGWTRRIQAHDELAALLMQASHVAAAADVEAAAR